MIKIAGPFNSGVAVGNNGAALINADSPIVLSGLVRGIYVKYLDTPPGATTDILITTKGTNAPAMTLLSKADNATDGWFYPVGPVHLNSTGAAIANEYLPMPIDDYINVKIDQANAGDGIDVYILLEV
jgi:hypothetical protein